MSPAVNNRPVAFSHGNLLAEQINTLHAEMAGHVSMAVNKAIEIGRLLSDQKAKLDHGEWIPWIEYNLMFDARQAQKYMRAYAKRDILNANHNSHLRSIDQVVALLAEPREQSGEPYEEPSVAEIVYRPDPDQQQRIQEAEAKAQAAEEKLSEAQAALSEILAKTKTNDQKLEAQKKELERLRKLDADREKIDKMLSEIRELEKRKADLLEDAESTKVVHDVLVRSREFFTKECMQIAALKLRPESVRVMRQDFKGLLDLVRNWLEAVENRFLEGD